MLCSNYKRKYPEDVIVFIEEFNKIEGTVVFDFFDSNEYLLFNGQDITDSQNGTNGSMVKLFNYNKRSVRENTYYVIKMDTIQNWRQNNLISTEIDSFVFENFIYLNDNDINSDEIFSTSITFGEFDSSYFNNYMYGRQNLDEVDFALRGELKVAVRNVGQGNWNEIISNDSCKIVYDAGAPMHATKNEIRKVIGNRGNEYIESNPGLIISHWDMDHYHSLLGMTDDELSSFSYVIFRDQVPSLTSRRLYSRLRNLIGVKKLYSIPAIAKAKKRGPTYLYPLNSTNNKLVVYNSEEHKNRNISGIYLSLKTIKSSVIFSADAHYDQISRDILPSLNYTHEHNLIVPHHGGRAGKFIYSRPSNVSFNIAVISVGINSYGHPIASYENMLKLNFKSVFKTKYKLKDVIIPL